MKNEVAAKNLACYLSCEKMEDTAFKKNVIEEIILNPNFKQVCDSEFKKLWRSIQNNDNENRD